MESAKTLPVVYLAGGMRTAWQDRVIGALFGRAVFMDPRTHGLKDEVQYTRWDIQALKSSHVVFAFLEKDNPSAAGLAFEAGYATAMGIPVIFVEESGHPNSRYFGMVRASSTVFTDLDTGISALADFCRDFHFSLRHGGLHEHP